MKAVYDRTKEDVQARNEKGVLRAEDLNRVGLNLKAVCENFGISFEPFFYQMEDKPPASHYNHILDKAGEARASYLVYPDTPELPRMPLTDYEKWNALERNIYDLHCTWLDNESRKRYCGENYTGEKELL